MNVNVDVPHVSTFLNVYCVYGCLSDAKKLKL